MPQPDEHGRYRPGHDCSIQVSLSRDGALIEKRPWDTLVCSAADIALVDGIHELDSAGWDQMIGLGVVPNALV